jgi:hypothetical protein
MLVQVLQHVGYRLDYLPIRLGEIHGFPGRVQPGAGAILTGLRPWSGFNTHHRLHDDLQGSGQQQNETGFDFIHAMEGAPKRFCRTSAMMPRSRGGGAGHGLMFSHEIQHDAAVDSTGCFAGCDLEVC